jgi:hypothetical protein
MIFEVHGYIYSGSSNSNYNPSFQLNIMSFALVLGDYNISQNFLH